jgi:hypothetical protein
VSASTTLLAYATSSHDVKFLLFFRLSRCKVTINVKKHQLRAIAFGAKEPAKTKGTTCSYKSMLLWKPFVHNPRWEFLI